MSAPWIHLEGFEGEGVYAVGEDERRHLAARRVREGDPLVVFDGRGGLGSARLACLRKREAEIEILETRRGAPSEGTLVVATAIPKGERLSTMLQMLSQLGVRAWQPLVLEDSTIRKLDVRAPRLRRILIEACKVARRPWMMEVREPTDLEAALGEAGENGRVAYGDREGAGVLSANVGSLFIGPEAGFSALERRRLSEEKAVAVALGEYNMRIEVAAVAGAAAHFRWAGDSKKTAGSTGIDAGE